jgi:hypothetical protein
MPEDQRSLPYISPRGTIEVLDLVKEETSSFLEDDKIGIREL